MQMVEIRRMAEDELKIDERIHAQSFARGDRSGVRDRQVYRATHRQTTFGLWDDRGLQTVFQVIDERTYLGPEVIVPTGYLSYIASRPETRGRGYAGMCLRYALEQMHAAGQIASTLSPFDYDFYRRFGWEWVGVNRRYSLSPHILKHDPETEHVRAATHDDRPRIQAAYAEFAGRYRGAIAREELHWAALLDDSDTHFTYTYVYENEGRLEGYLVDNGQRSSGEEAWLREFLCLTPDAQRAVLGLLRRQQMTFKKVSWDAPEDDGLWCRDYHREMETRLTPVIQGRVVDAPAALRAWRPARFVRGKLLLSLRDECAPWNTGTWLVEFEEGSVSVSSTPQEAQVFMDIQAFSQAFFGTPTVEVLRKQQRLRVQDEAGYAALCQLLAGPPMWLCEG